MLRTPVQLVLLLLIAGALGCPGEAPRSSDGGVTGDGGLTGDGTTADGMVAGDGGIDAQPRYAVVDVRDHGAQGDGVSDDASALQAAIDAAALQCGPGVEPLLWLGPGEFVISDTLVVDGCPVTLLGTGWTNPPGYVGGTNAGFGTSVRWAEGAGPKPMFEVRSPGARFLHFRIQGNDAPADTPTAGIRFHGTEGRGAVDSMWIGVWPWTLVGTHVGVIEVGVLVDGPAHPEDQLLVSGSVFRGCTAAGIQTHNAQARWNHLINTTFDANTYSVSSNAHTAGRNLYFNRSSGADLRTEDPAGTPQIDVRGFFSENTSQVFDIASSGARVTLQGGYIQIGDITGEHFADFYPAGAGARLELRDIQFTQNTLAPRPTLRFKPTSTAGVTSAPPALLLWNDWGLELDTQLDVGLVDGSDARALLLLATPGASSSVTLDHLSGTDTVQLGRVRPWPPGVSDPPTPPDPPTTAPSPLIAALTAVSAHLVGARDFGAAGDGVTDDTAALQAAIDHLLNPDNTGVGIRGGVLWLGDGDYVISDTLYIHRGAITFVGTGWTHPGGHAGALPSGNGTILSWSGGAGNRPMIEVTDSLGSRFLNFRIRGNTQGPQRPTAAIAFTKEASHQIGTNAYDVVDGMWIGEAGDLDHAVLVAGDNGDNDTLTVQRSVLQGAVVAAIQTHNSQSVWNHYSQVAFLNNHYGLSTAASVAAFDLQFHGSAGADLHTPHPADATGVAVTAQIWLWGYQSVGAAQLVKCHSRNAQLMVQGGSADLGSVTSGSFLEWDPVGSDSKLQLRGIDFLNTPSSSPPTLRLWSDLATMPIRAPIVMLWNCAGLELDEQLDIALVSTSDARALLLYEAGQPGTYTMDFLSGTDTFLLGDVQPWPNSTDAVLHPHWATVFP